MGKMNRLFVLLLAVFIAGNDCAFPNDDTNDIKNEKNIPDEAVFRENRATTRTEYISAESNYTITSTGYPYYTYPNNADDIWYLQTDKGRIIQLTFVSFRLESGYDYLKGGDGEDASTAQLFSLSGSVIPTDKVSSGNKMWLRFTSDGSVTLPGFKIVAQSVSMTDYTTEPSYYGCSSYQWRCYYNGQCIQDYQRCNGYSDCLYGEDEYNCYDYTTEPPYYGCSSYEWRCYYNGQCIQDYQRCNGYSDCYYGEDEYDCYDYTTEPSYYGCSSYEWRCYNNGQCIQDYQRCNGYSDCYYGEDEYNCYGNTVAPTVDVNLPSSVIRLVNGSTIYEGRVEVFVNGSWGTACSHSWGMDDARVVCRQLGYGPAISAPRDATYGAGVGPIHLVHVYCNGSESSILDCTSYYSEHCYHSEDAGVECTAPLTVRLVNGGSLNEGRVEVFYQGQWGTVCDDGWGINDAHVVCRMLGYPSAYQAWGSAHFGQGSGPIMLDNVNCQGNEHDIADCYHNGWFSHNCGHNEDAGVTCNSDYTTEPSYGCSSYEWQCSYSGQCIQDYQRCNGYSDCYSGEDEYDCYGYATEPSYGCSSYEWQCYNGQCIQDYQRCNGYSDCYSGEDEYDCYDTFRCSNGDEIPMKYTCDRIIDCQYGEDEWQNCNDNEVKRDNIESYPRREKVLPKEKNDEQDP